MFLSRPIGSQGAQGEVLHAALSARVTYCEDVSWADKAEKEAREADSLDLYQWIKYRVACDQINMEEVRRGQAYKYIHKVRTDCDCRSLHIVTSSSHEADLNCFDGLYVESDYTWSGKRKNSMQLSEMYDYLKNTILYRSRVQISYVQMGASKVS